MKNRIVRIGTVLLAMISFHMQLQSQNIARTGYFVENATHRHLMNPALTPLRGYVSFPVAGEFSLNLESNTALSTYLYPSADGSQLFTFLHEDVTADQFLSQLDPKNYIRTDLRTSLLSFGFFSGKSFWTFDLATRAHAGLNIPYEMFEFLKLGMTSSQGNLYEIRDLNINANAFVEASLGYSRNIMNNLRVGGKLKFLAGGASLIANVKQMDIEMRPEQWTITTIGELNAYGKGLALVKDSAGVIENVDFDSPGLGGMGAAIDLGVTYSPIPNLEISAAIIDLGAIRWNQENIKSAAASGSVTFSGIDNIGTDEGNEDEMDAQMEQLEEDLLKMAEFKEVYATEDFMERLNPTVNAGLEYSFLRNRISVGGLYSARFMENETYNELTGSLNLKPARWFNLTGSYSVMHGVKETFGFALGFAPTIINIFLACDYTFYNVTPTFLPINTATTNFQLGVSIPLAFGKLPAKH